tara:strand:+ start:78 stop:251 length:174 start_codon:yes stop_codon:yes gene_type:complete
MLLPVLLGAVFDIIILELPLNVTAALLDIYIAPALICDERKNKKKEKDIPKDICRTK